MEIKIVLVVHHSGEVCKILKFFTLRAEKYYLPNRWFFISLIFIFIDKMHLWNKSQSNVNKRCDLWNRTSTFSSWWLVLIEKEVLWEFHIPDLVSWTIGWKLAWQFEFLSWKILLLRKSTWKFELSLSIIIFFSPRTAGFILTKFLEQL